MNAFCTSCGTAQRAPGGRFCDTCGAPLAAAAAPSEGGRPGVTPDRPARRSRGQSLLGRVPGGLLARVPAGVRTAIVGVAVGGVGLFLLAIVGLLLINGSAQANAARWVDAQIAALPVSVSYDGLTTHPVLGRVSLANVRVAERSGQPYLADADADGAASRVDIEVPRAFFVLAALDRLPTTGGTGNGRVDAVHVAAHDVRVLDRGREVMQMDEARVDFDGDAPTAAPPGGDDALLRDLLASNQRLRVEMTGLSTVFSGGMLNMFVLGYQPRDSNGPSLTRMYDEVAYEVAYDARRRRVRLVEASGRRGDASVRISGAAVLTPAFVAGNDDGVPVETAEVEFEARSSSPVTLPLPDGSSVEVGDAEIQTRGPLRIAFATDVGAGSAVPTLLAGRVSGSVSGVRLLLSPDAASAFDSQIGREMGLYAATLAEPASFAGDVELRDGRLAIRRAEARTGVGRARATGVLRVDLARPQASFFEEPLRLSLTDLDPALEASVARFGELLAQSFRVPPPVRDGGGLTMEFGGTLEQF